MLRRLMQEALQHVLEAELTEAVGASPGERTAGRLGYRAGYYSRGLATRIGKLELRVTRDRDGRCSTELFARYQRSENALVSALADLYVQGVSTRKIKAITEELCGHTFSASTISRINTSLDSVLSRFADRRLDEVYPHLVLDARYEKVRLDGVIQSQAVLVAIGINGDGRRCVLGVQLWNRESRSRWTTFVKGLKARGLHRVECVMSDDHAGLKRAVAELLPEAVWQRCYMHFLRNALDYLPRTADDDCRQELPLALRPPRPRGGPAGPAGVAPAAGPALSAAHRIRRDPHRRDAHLLPATAPTPQAPQIDQPARTAQRGNQAPHPSGPHLPESGQLPAAGPGALRRDPRGVARRSPRPEYGRPQGAEKGPAARRSVKEIDLSHHTEFAKRDVHNPTLVAAQYPAMGIAGSGFSAFLTKFWSEPPRSPSSIQVLDCRCLRCVRGGIPLADPTP